VHPDPRDSRLHTVPHDLLGDVRGCYADDAVNPVWRGLEIGITCIALELG
jgi:hypothetical protein